MTITNRFHIRKLQLIMGAYRLRYAKRREKRAQGIRTVIAVKEELRC